MGGSEGIFGGAVTADGGSYTGERGRCRWGLDVGERAAAELAMREGDCGCGADPLAVVVGVVVVGRAAVVVMLSLREKLGWCWCWCWCWCWWCGWSACCWPRVLAAVLWDQRFTLCEAGGPSLEVAMPSAAPLAALERRLAVVGGGVARGWGGLVEGEGDEMEPLRDDWRRCEAWSGCAVVVFMLEQPSSRPSRQECVSQAKPAVNAMRMQAWLPQAGTRWGRRR
jgi:hypothetical protein